MVFWKANMTLSVSVLSLETRIPMHACMGFQTEEKHATAGSYQSIDIGFCVSPLLGPTLHRNAQCEGI